MQKTKAQTYFDKSTRYDLSKIIQLAASVTSLLLPRQKRYKYFPAKIEIYFMKSDDTFGPGRQFVAASLIKEGSLADVDRKKIWLHYMNKSAPLKKKVSLFKERFSFLGRNRMEVTHLSDFL